jgi:hypothetical protein
MEMEELNTSLMNKMFDKFWYANQASVEPVEATLDHYLTSANVQRSPSPYFDTDYYLRMNPDVQATGMAPFIHFCNYGCDEGRAPSPFFDTEWYAEHHQKNTDIAAFEDFLDGEGTYPNRSFFSHWYASEYSVSGDAFHHFLVHGRYQGYNPNPIFKVKYLKDKLDASKMKTKLSDVYEKYLTNKSYQEISFSPLFDVEYFTTTYIKEMGVLPSNPLHDFLASDATINPSSVFDRAYYNSNVENKAFENELCDYYSKAIKDRTSANILFDTREYFLTRPDVVGYDPFEHYLASGFRETVGLGCFFDNDFYREKYLNNEKKIAPLSHYLEIGIKKGNQIRRPQPVIAYAEREKNPSITVIDPSIYSESDSLSLNKGLFFHVFYTDLVEDLIQLANNVPAPAKVFISTDSHIKALEIEKITESLSEHECEVRVFENRGRDISPFVVGFADRIQEVDIGCHLHTKKSQHYKSSFNDWRNYLFQQNLGSKEIVSSILKQFDNPKVGMVAPSDFQPIDPLIQWGGNLRLVRSLVRKVSDSKHELGEKTPLELPSGSMFWFRSNALKPLLDLNLNNTAFDPELGQVDGTLAHAIERSFFYFAEIAGFEWIRCFTSNNEMSKQLLANESAGEAGHLLPLDSANNALLLSVPEVRSFSLIKDTSKRKRINLIIPTSDKATGYAGVSEALRIFLGSLERLGLKDYDCRIIDSDIPLSNQYCPPEGFKVCDLDDSNRAGCFVVDGSTRQYKHLAVRENDIFFASAWWTAHSCREVLAKMKGLFGNTDRKFVYLIQDYESCFYPWSTKYMLAEDTYSNNDDIVPVFNTSILFDFFVSKGLFSNGIVYSPPINEKLAMSFDSSLERENKVLIYMRPHAERNCLSFSERLVELLYERDPQFWGEWTFYAVGEDFDSDKYLASNKITVLGRLSLDDYAKEVSTSKVGMSFMVSPHPSYPPLEMAAGGMSVITNNYENKNLSALHPLIHSLDGFNVNDYADLIRGVCDGSHEASSVPPVDWFFAGKSNKEEVCESVCSEIEGMFN